MNSFKRPQVVQMRKIAFESGDLERQRLVDDVRFEKDRVLDHISNQPIIDADTITHEKARPQQLIDAGLIAPYLYIGVVEAETINTARMIRELFGDSPFIDPWCEQETGHGEMYQRKLEMISAEPVEIPEFSLSETEELVARAKTLIPRLHPAFDYTRALTGRFNEHCNAVVQGKVRQKEKATGHDVLASATGHAVRQELWHADYYDLEALELELTIHPALLLIGREAALHNFNLVGAFTPERESLCAQMLDDLSNGDVDTLVGRPAIQNAKQDLISGHQTLVSDGPLIGVAKYALRRLGREQSYAKSVDRALGATAETVAS